jgi:AbrB family looped-hinge helix DNA binding protein
MNVVARKAAIARRKKTGVTILKLHDDGWLALPAAARRKLGLATGDLLEVELARDGAILLRPAGAVAPRQVPAAEPVPEAATPMPETTAEAQAEPRPGAASELRRRAEPPAPDGEPEPPPGWRPERPRPAPGYEREERRPFRNVEIRKLGPGRGRSKAARLAS